MISQGYTDEEIGRFLGYTRQYINRLKKKILKKLILNTKTHGYSTKYQNTNHGFFFMFAFQN